MAYFKTLPHNLIGGAEENKGKSLSVTMGIQVTVNQCLRHY
jgi:hypothetical protein